VHRKYFRCHTASRQFRTYWGKETKRRNSDFSSRPSFSLEKALKRGAGGTEFGEIRRHLDSDISHSTVKNTLSILETELLS